MPHTEGHIEPQVQGDPQGLDYQAIYQKYYDKGLDIEKATRKMRVLYGAKQPELDALNAFYESKKKSQDGTTASDSSSETVSTVSTSGTAPSTGQENGDTDSPLAAPDPLSPQLYDSITPAPLPRTFVHLAQAEIISQSRPENWEDIYISKFGEGEVHQLDTKKLFSEQRDQSIMAAVNVIEVDAFDRWYKKKLEDGRTKTLVDQYLNLDTEEIAKLKRQLSREDGSKHSIKDSIMEMFAALEDAPEGQLTHPGFVRKYQLGVDKTSKKSLKKVENDFGNFYRDMVKESLPYSVQQNESQLKDLEYYFKYGNGDMFDFTEDGEVGNQTWWSQTQLTGEVAGMTLVNKLSFLGSRVGGWMADTVLGEGMGDVFREGLEPRLQEREKKLEEIRGRMNVFEKGISKSYGEFFTTGDLTALDNALEQSWYMAVEASPQISLAVASGAMGMGPTGIALLLTADGTMQEAMMIRNDISFDDFVDKKSAPRIENLKEDIDAILRVREGDGGKENYKGKELQALRELLKKELKESRLSYSEALSTIKVVEGDTQEDIENKLKAKYDIEVNQSNRTMYLSSTAAVDFAADLVMFNIFRRAFRGADFGQDATIKTYAKNILRGSGVALPEAAIPTFLSMYNREYQKAKYTDSDFDAKQAFEAALDVTLGMAPLGPMLHTAGSSLAYTKHLGRSADGPGGINVYHRRVIDKLNKKATDPDVNSNDRAQAIKLAAKFKRDGVLIFEKNTALYDYIGKKDPASLDEIANLHLQLESLLRSLKGVEDPNVKMLMRDELASIVSKKAKVEAEFKEGFEAQYDHSYVRQKFEDGKKGIVEVKPDLDAKATEEIAARETVEWVQDNIKEKPPTTLNRQRLEEILSSKDHAMLSAENPKGKGQGEKSNAEANSKAIEWLKKQGLKYHEITGKYGPGENSILVEGMTLDQAKAFAGLFDQHSVAHGEGLVKSDGSLLPFEDGINFDVDLKNPDSDYYSAVKLSDGTVVGFKKEPSNSGTDADGKPISGDDFYSSGVKSPDADPLVRPDDSEAPPVREPQEGDARMGDDTEGVVAEERKLADIKGGRVRQFLRDTFRSDSGIGGKRGWKIWKQRTGAREKVAETIRGREREMRVMSNQLSLDLGVLDALYIGAEFDGSGKKIGKNEYDRRKAELNKYMNGEEARIAFLSDEGKAKLDFLRAKVDGLSGEMIRLLEENPTDKNKALVETIRNNQGQYLKRSYEAFTDNGTWIKDFNKKKLSKTKQKLYDDAVQFIMDSKGVDRIKANEEVKSYLQDLYGKLNDKSFIAGSGLIGALDSKVLSGRKDIPEPFRKLLGEVENVSFNYVNTVHRLAGYVADLSFQKVLRADLLEAGLAVEGAGREGVPFLTGSQFSGLDGLFVDPAFQPMYDGMMPLTSNPSKIMRMFTGFQGAVKIGKTVYSPTTTSRNLLSGVFLGFNSGHLFSTDLGKASDAMKLAWGIEEGIDINFMTRERDKLMKYGIIGDGARAGEVMGIMRDFTNATEAQRIAEKSGGSKLRKATRKVNDAAQKLYAFGDDFYKTTGFYTETQRFIDSGMDRATAQKRAAERIRGGYPTYSYIPKNIKWLRRFPLSGMFVSFPYEVYRTTANNMRYAAQDFAEGRTKMGMQRMLGMTTAHAFGFGMFSATKDLFNYTEEELDAIRLLGPEYQKNSQPIFMPRGEGDEIKFIDAQAILPNEAIWKPIRSLILQGDPKDENYIDGIESAILEVLSPAISMDASAKLVHELMTNRREGTDQPIYYWDQDMNPFENALNNIPAATRHILKGIGPGAYNNLEEFFRANDINPEVFGEKSTVYKETKINEWILGLFGFRVNTFDMRAGVLPKIYEDSEDLKKYTNFNLSNKDIRLLSDKPIEYLKDKADQYVNKQIEVAKRVQVYPSVAIEAGLEEGELITTLVNSGLSKKNAGILVANAIEGTNLPQNPKYITLSRIKSVLTSVRDAHRGSKEELKEKTDAVMEAMFLSNVMIIDKWSMQFENYDIKNDEEEDNQDFRRQYLNRNKP